jgi:hypothetical protein
MINKFSLRALSDKYGAYARVGTPTVVKFSFHAVPSPASTGLRALPKILETVSLVEMYDLTSRLNWNA